MEGSETYIQLLAQVPAFAAFSPAQLQTLYRYCTLKVLAKGEAASIAGAPVDEYSRVIEIPGLPALGGTPPTPGVACLWGILSRGGAFRQKQAPADAAGCVA